jgi:hypothetical protein
MSAASRSTLTSPSEPRLGPVPAPQPELLRALGRLARGLSALFWGLPIALVVCVQTAKGDWLRPLGVLPPVLSTGLLFYALTLLGHFQKQERVWRVARERARILALINVGLSPFLFWWNVIPGQPLYDVMVDLMIVTGLLFLFTLNPMIGRLAAMLPDETLRVETRFFSHLNRYLLLFTLALMLAYYVMVQLDQLPPRLIHYLFAENGRGLWAMLLLVLLPLAMTMALLWKIKEVILASVFGPES